MLALALSVLRFTGCGPLDLLDTRAVDLRLLYRGPQPPSGQVVIVAIDDASIESQGRWPWPRDAMARLLRAISAAQPRVVGFDIVQAEPTRPLDFSALRSRLQNVDERTKDALGQALDALPGDDRTLADAVRDSGRTVLGYYFDFSRELPASSTAVKVSTYNAVRSSPSGRGERRIKNPTVAVGNLPELTAAARGTGYVNFLPDVGDGYLRRVPLAMHYQDKYALPLALAMLQVAEPERQLVLAFEDFGVEAVKAGPATIPVDEDGRLALNFRGPGKTFAYVSAADVLSGRVAPERLAGKFVLVGVTATGVVDVRPTAFDGLFPGVEMQATALDNMLAGDALVQPRWAVLVEIGAMLLFVMVLGFLLGSARDAIGGAFAAACLAGYLGGSQWLFLRTGIPLGLVFPAMAIVLTYSIVNVHLFLVAEGARRRTREAFSRYLNPELARIASENPSMLKLGGDKRELTILFSDIRGFTSISEGLAPETLVELLNAYLTVMTDVVFDHEGTLDKYIGDAILAVWGAPLPQPDHARRACSTALAMVDALEKVSELSRTHGWPRLDMGIGLHTGEMIVGNMGSTQHLSYTVVGDNVNLGSRLEGLTRIYNVHVLASEATVIAAGDGFASRELDLVAVKGRSQPVRIFELTARGDGAVRSVDQFAAGLGAYRRRDWNGALARFEAVLKDRPDDGPSKLYMRRCRDFAQSEPPPDWQGVTVMETK